MAQEIRLFDLNEAQTKEWRSLIESKREEFRQKGYEGGNGYCRISTTLLPPSPVEKIYPKAHDAYLFISGVAGQDVIAFSAILNRVDHTAIDQHPIGGLIPPAGTNARISIVDHGDWTDRTDKMYTKAELNLVRLSGITAVFSSKIPNDDMGPLTVLSGSQRIAAENAIDPFINNP